MARILTVPLAAALLLGAASAARAQAPSLAARAGVVVSTPLVDDVDAGHIRPAPAPMVALSAAVPLRPRLAAQAEIGWTFATLRGDDGIQEWDAQELGIGHATLGLRFAMDGPLYLRGGLGLVRLAGQEGGLFEGGAVTEPLVEAGAGAEWEVGPGVASIELLGQAHSFGSEALRRAEGFDGTVYRLALRAGLTWGGRP